MHRDTQWSFGSNEKLFLCIYLVLAFGLMSGVAGYIIGKG